MLDRSSRRTTAAFFTCAAVAVAAAGAVTAIAAGAQHRYAACAVALLALSGSALGAYFASRARDAEVDRSVLRQLNATRHQRVDDIAVALALRPAVVRLSLRRRSTAGRLPAGVDDGREPSV